MAIFLKHKIISTVSALVLGFVFVISALLKLQSIDEFEIYVYSFAYLSLNWAFILARLLIAIELLLGLLLLSGLYKKLVVNLSACMLLVFSVFLLYLILSNNSEHCHCFGSQLELSHPLSLFKNMLLLLLLFFARSSSFVLIKAYRWAQLLLLSLLSISLPFIVSPPDSFNMEAYSVHEKHNAALLKQYIEEEVDTEQTKLLCFFGVHCSYCQLAAKKINVIAEKTQQGDSFFYAFWAGEGQLKPFFEQTHTQERAYQILEPSRFLKITGGTMPLIVLLKQGEIHKVYGYRDLDESYIIQFLEP